jgi:hypothetical protein
MIGGRSKVADPGRPKAAVSLVKSKILLPNVRRNGIALSNLTARAGGFHPK